jgi:hypothetical protein
MAENMTVAPNPSLTHRIFGLTLISDFPFANRLAPGSGTPDLRFSCVDEPPFFVSWRKQKPTFISPALIAENVSSCYLYRLEECDVLRFTTIADFFLFSGRIVCHLLEPKHTHLVEIALLGTVLAVWMEREGIPMLHAAAVEVDERAAAFLATNKGGKSSLAASLMQAGHSLLTDDILPLQETDDGFLGVPGYPTMRMWPGEAQQFVGHFDDLPLAHPQLSKRRVFIGPDGFGHFCDCSQPLACFYLPQRRDDITEVQIRPVKGTKAVIELIRSTFTPRIVRALDWQDWRLTFFAQMAAQTPVRRIVYPNGFEHLPRVNAAILEDLSKLMQ